MNPKDITSHSVGNERIADLLAFESEHANAPLDEKLLKQLIDEPSSHTHIVEVDGKVAGYVLYRHDDTYHQNSILRFVVADNMQEQAKAVQEHMLDIVKSDMSVEGRAHIVVYAKTGDDDLFNFFNKSRDFTHLKGDGSDHHVMIYEMPEHRKQRDANAQPPMDPILPPADSGLYTSIIGYAGINPEDNIIPMSDEPPQIIMPDGTEVPNDNIIFGAGMPNPTVDLTSQEIHDVVFGGDSEIEPPEENTNDTNAKKYRESSPELCREMKSKLTELTNMEWEIVSWGKGNKMSAITPDAQTDMSNVFLRTANKVSSVKDALGSVAEFFGEKVAHTQSGKLDMAGQVVIPSSWARPVHLTLGQAGMMADTFKPASTQLRYKCKDELDEETRRKAQGR